MTAQTTQSNPKASEDTEVDEVDTNEGEDTAPVVDASDYSIDEAKAKVQDEKSFNKDFEKAVKFIGQSREAIHALLVQGLLAARVNNDYARMTKILRMLNDGLSTASTVQIRRWIMAMGPFRWVRTEKDGYKFRKSNSKDAAVFNIRFAEANPFWKWSPVSEEDMDEMVTINPEKDIAPIRNLFHRIKDKLELLKTNPDKVEAVSKEALAKEEELLEDLRTILHKYAGVDSTKDKASVKKAA